MTEIKSICVYCGTGTGTSPVYAETARKLGRMIGENGIRLVYGGGRVGLMGVVSEAAVQAGAKVTGIIPEHIQSTEVKNTDVDELHIVDSMHTRKNMMVDRSDAFVTLPGGFGTLDETFEILTWKYLRLHDKPVVIVNVDDYWTKFVEMVDHMIAKGFVQEWHKELYTVVTDVDEVLPALMQSRDPDVRTDLRRL